MRKNDLAKNVQALKDITSMFRLERMVYISAIVICLFVLLISFAATLTNKGESGSSAEISTMFGSGGAATVMTGRLLHMWNRAINILEQSNAA